MISRRTNKVTATARDGEISVAVRDVETLSLGEVVHESTRFLWSHGKLWRHGRHQRLNDIELQFHAQWLTSLCEPYRDGSSLTEVRSG